MWRLVRASVSVRASGFGCATWARYLSASSSPITNIGISAHIDSGKTTLTGDLAVFGASSLTLTFVLQNEFCITQVCWLIGSMHRHLLSWLRRSHP